MNSTVTSNPILEARSLTPEEIRKFKTEGYLMLRQLVSSEHAASLHDEVMKIMKIVGLGQTKLRQTAQYLRNSVLADYIQSSELRSLATALLESPAHLYLPFTAVKSSGGAQFHFHQDGNYTRYCRGAGLNFWMALVPMRCENGGLSIVPSSHMRGELPAENAGDGDSHLKVSCEPVGSKLMEMEPGDCVVFNRWTVHGSGPNLTQRPRAAYAVQFHSEDAARLVNGVEKTLLETPRFTDIWGVDEIVSANAGSRDGH